MKQSIRIFQGGRSQDTRGSVSYNNNFTFEGVKRFYQLENAEDQPIRAFHGHMKEAKYFSVVSGTILLCLASIDNPDNPSKEAKVRSFVLSAENPQIVYVPPGFANGFKSLEKNTKVIVYSTATLQQSKDDDYRYPEDYWGMSIWTPKS